MHKPSLDCLQSILTAVESLLAETAPKATIQKLTLSGEPNPKGMAIQLRLMLAEPGENPWEMAYTHLVTVTSPAERGPLPPKEPAPESPVKVVPKRT